MTCEELREDYGAYALGIAEDPERSEISHHCATGCPACVPGVRSAFRTVAALSGSVTPVAVPKGLRRRVIAMVDPNAGHSRWTWLPWGAVAAMAVILLSVVLPARRAQEDTSKLADALSILNDPVTRDATFGDPAAKGRVFVSPNKGIVLIASHLPKIAAGKTFELWVIPNGAKPIPAGTFDAREDSTALYIYKGSASDAAIVAVTVEPSGGSPQPTSPPFIAAKL